MKASDIFTLDNLRVVRASWMGFAAKYDDLFLGRPIKQDVQKGTTVNWNLIRGNTSQRYLLIQMIAVSINNVEIKLIILLSK